MTTHNVTRCLSARCIITLQGTKYYITVLRQCKCAVNFYYIYIISLNIPNVIQVKI
jgi:hypothetical protein